MSAPIVIVEAPAAPPISVVNPPAPPAVVIVEPAGPKGAKGDDGPQGPPGPPGGAAFQFAQSLPSAHWVITHGLGSIPSVTVIDSANREVYGDVTFLDNNNLVIDFASAFSGTAYLL